MHVEFVKKKFWIQIRTTMQNILKINIVTKKLFLLGLIYSPNGLFCLDHKHILRILASV